MNLLEAMDIIGISQEEYEKMNVIKLTQAYTKARTQTHQAGQADLNRAYTLLLETKKDRIKFKSKMKEAKEREVTSSRDYSKIGVKSNIYPIVSRKLNNYKANIAWDKSMKQIVLPLNVIFDGVPEEEFIITPNWMKQGTTIFGYMDKAVVPYELTVK